MIRDTHIKQFVIDAGMATRSELAAAERDAAALGTSLDRALIHRGALTQEDVHRMHAYLAGIPYVSLIRRSIEASVLALIPEPLAREHRLVAFERQGDVLKVAALDPASRAVLDDVQASFDGRIIPHITDTQSMQHALKQYQSFLRTEFGSAIARDAALCVTSAGSGAGDEAAARTVDMLLRHAVAQQASDIHIESHGGSLLVRYRICGSLRNAMTLPEHAGAALAARLRELATAAPGIGRSLEGRFRAEVGGERISCRVSFVPTVSGEQIVVRLVREGRAGYSLEGLGLFGTARERVYAALRRRGGLIIASGERGSGRTTTLYTLLDVLNTPEMSLATLEQPVAHILPGVNQVVVDSEAGLSVADGIRMLRRQNPDVLMIGDLTDAEAARGAVSAALGGTTLMTAVESASAYDAIRALIDMGVDPEYVAAACTLIVGQRLVPRLAAAEPYILSAAERDQLARTVDLERVRAALIDDRNVPEGATWNSIPFYRPASSTEYPEGYAGRVALFEVLSVTPALRDALADGAHASHMARIARAGGMLTMAEDGVYKAALGLVALEDVVPGR